MIEKTFQEVYNRFKLHFYQEIFRELPDRDATLSATEAFAVEIIHTLNTPTIGEFANFIHISLPNATYRVNALVKKGYIRKLPSPSDKREIRLQLTERFYHYYNISCDYIQKIMTSMSNRLSEGECAQFVKTLESMLHIMDECREEIGDESENIG